MNEAGHTSTLVAAHPGNRNRELHGVYGSGRALAPRAAEVAEAIMAQPHTVELDQLGAEEIGRLQAMIEAIDTDLSERGLTGRRGDVRAMVDLRLRASRRLAEWLDRYGANPKGRADWAKQLADGGLAEEIRRRRGAIQADA
jgi:hypothetical protein